MKTRDIIKYAVALTIACITLAAIAVMQVVKYDRRARSDDERRRIEEVFRQNNIPAGMPAPTERTAVAPVATPDRAPGGSAPGGAASRP